VRETDCVALWLTAGAGGRGRNMTSLSKVRNAQRRIPWKIGTENSKRRERLLIKKKQ